MSGRNSTHGLFVLTFALGCREVVGIETRGEGPPLLALPEGCLACVESACPEPERACAADPDCALLAACVAGEPDDPAGRAACEQASPAAASNASYLALDACMRAPCQDDCTGIKGLLAGRSADCDTCLATACEPEYRACIADRSCERTVSSAYTGPMTPPKAISVDNAPGIAGAPLRALDDCLGVEACTPACGIDGSDFSCVSEFEWPGAEQSSASLDALVLLTDLLSATPLSEVVVQACEPHSLPCVPVSTATTDASGVASLPIAIPIQPYPFRGYASLVDPSPTPRFLPTSVFFGRPVYASTWGSMNVFAEPTLDLVAGVAGTSPVAGRGQVLTLFLDCNGRLADGVTLTPNTQVEFDERTVIDYPGGPPTKDGLVLLLNVVPGCHDLSGVVGVEETHRARVPVAPGVITVAFVYPKSTQDDLDSVCIP